MSCNVPGGILRLHQDFSILALWKLGKTILFCGRSCSVHCKVFSISGFYYKYSILSIPTCTPGGRNYDAPHFVGGHSETRCSVQGHAVSAAELGPHPGHLTPKSGLPRRFSRGFCATQPWVPPKPQPLAQGQMCPVCSAPDGEGRGDVPAAAALGSHSQLSLWT